MITKAEVVDLFNAGIDCSMVVLGEVADKLGITKEEAYKVSSCFGAGMMNGSVCGAVTGAYMALGLRFGNGKPGEMSQKGLLMNKKTEFIDAFNELHGDVICPNLIKFDLRDPEQYKAASDQKVLATLCPDFCIDAIRILEKML